MGKPLSGRWARKHEERGGDDSSYVMDKKLQQVGRQTIVNRLMGGSAALQQRRSSAADQNGKALGTKKSQVANSAMLGSVAESAVGSHEVPAATLRVLLGKIFGTVLLCIGCLLIVMWLRMRICRKSPVPFWK